LNSTCVPDVATATCSYDQQRVDKDLAMIPTAVVHCRCHRYHRWMLIQQRRKKKL
jgi:hypothetical protein